VLREQPILNLDKLHGRGAFLIIVPDMIDPRADWIAPHQPSVIEFHRVGNHGHILHAEVEPQIEAVWIEYDWHPVVDCRGDGIWGRGQNRAGLRPFAAWIFPAIPDSGEGAESVYLTGMMNTADRSLAMVD
jgi:hypothetical protein